MASDPRPAHLASLAAINRNLGRLGVAPLVDLDAAAALEVESLVEVVRSSGRYLAAVTRALEGAS